MKSREHISVSLHKINDGGHNSNKIYWNVCIFHTCVRAREGPNQSVGGGSRKLGSKEKAFGYLVGQDSRDGSLVRLLWTPMAQAHLGSAGASCQIICCDTLRLRASDFPSLGEGYKTISATARKP